jgi:hypothetical protein
MNRRTITLLGIAAALGIAYVVFFTDWISPEPIQIASQVRPVIQQPRFGRSSSKAVPGNPFTTDTRGNVLTPVAGQPTPTETRRPLPPTGPPEASPLVEPANGVAHVTFSLDARYSLTSLRVLEVGPDGSRGRIVWDLKGKSRPLNGLIYGRNPAGMEPTTPDALAASLEPGTLYRLEVAAGRRKGTNVFQTVVRPPPPTE